MTGSDNEESDTEVQQIVINRCFGGFGISHAALDRLVEEHGYETTGYDDEGEYENPDADIIDDEGHVSHHYSLLDRREAATRTRPELVTVVEETDSPVALDRDIPITTRWCLECGERVGLGQWDVHEEHEIARVTPSQEVPTFRTDKENDRIIVGNTAVFVLDESGERMAVDHASDLDGYVAFKEKGDTEGVVKSNGEQATLHFTEV